MRHPAFSETRGGGIAAVNFMSYIVIALVAALASALTFFSGFGLGTLLMPAFAFFVPVELAIGMTAVVHFANGLFKVALVGGNAGRRVVFRFGVPAILAAFAGALALGALADLPPWYAYPVGERVFTVTPVKAAVGALLIAFTLWETLPSTKDRQFGPRWMPLGGVLSGFFGGLSGNQGALRSAFLVRAGLDKAAFIGTGAVIACLIDVTRLGTYTRQFAAARESIDYALLATGILAAFAGAYWGNRKLRKITLASVQRIVAAMVFLVGVGLMAGVL